MDLSKVVQRTFDLIAHAFGGGVIAAIWIVLSLHYYPRAVPTPAIAFLSLWLFGLVRELVQMERSGDTGFGAARAMESAAWGVGTIVPCLMLL